MENVFYALENVHRRTALTAGLAIAPNLHEYLRSGRTGDGLCRIGRHPHVGGKRVHDCVWAEVLPLFSPKLVSILEQSSLTGWTTYPIDVEPEIDVLNGYRALGVTGRCRRVGFVKDRAHVVEQGPGYALIKGLYVDGDSWDGSDFFMGLDSGFIIVTHAVRTMFERFKIGNVALVPVEEVTTTIDPPD